MTPETGHRAVTALALAGVWPVISHPSVWPNHQSGLKRPRFP